LPEFDRIPGVRLSGKAFADCLMVVEFVHNFASILGFGNSSYTLLLFCNCKNVLPTVKQQFSASVEDALDICCKYV